MTITSFEDNLQFNKERVVSKVIIETPFSKEIRILLGKNQFMKEHKAPFPIIIHILSGEIDFGLAGEVHALKKGDILSLEANVPHNLKALQDSVVRLSLSKSDKSERIEKVIG